MIVTYSLNQVAKMFRMDSRTIKRMALDGELPYRVNGEGRFVFTREDLLPHVDRMTERNNRIV